MNPAEQLSAPQWRARAAAHADRVDALTAGHTGRRVQGRTHPVEDFLFVYYRHSPARLRRWHPGPGVRLAPDPGMPHAGWTHYASAPDGTVGLDVGSFLAARGESVAFVRELLTATLDRPARLGCLGLHEWAMVYRASAEEVRHQGWPLRLGPAGTDDVVEAHEIRCSHFDAYRFFTPAATPRNRLRPTRELQAALEQPGCLHAGMDLYKWAFKLAPAIPSELTVDAFEHALAARALDMEASPYDLADLGVAPLRIETAEGKAAYVQRQRELADASNVLRQRLLAVLDGLLASTP